jgi:thioredoxin 1
MRSILAVSALLALVAVIGAAEPEHPANVIMVADAKAFDQQIAASKDRAGITVVDFWAPWCGPCMKLGPELEALAKSHADLTVLKVNVDDNADLAKRFDISSIPLLVKYEKGKESARETGFVSADVLAKWLGFKQ